MPFTPFHMGPALAVKAATRRYFNVPVFAFTQVGIDSEVLIGLPFRGDLTNHAVLHTLGGGALIAIIAILLLRPVIQPGARLWNHLAGVKPDSFMYMETRVPRSAAVISAVIGSGSHVLLDAMSHPDMTPFAPLAWGNPFSGALTSVQVTVLCLALWAAGGGAILAFAYLRRRRGR